MTKEQLFEKIDFEEGDQIHIILAKKMIKDGIVRKREFRINHGFDIYELLGMVIKIKRDIYKTFDHEIEEPDLVKVKRIYLADEEEKKEECVHDYISLEKIKKTWNNGSDGRNGSSSGSDERAVLKCSKCGDIKVITI